MNTHGFNGRGNGKPRITYAVFLSVIISIFIRLNPCVASIITNPELTSLSDSSMVITWTTTDEAATTQILYGIGGLTSSVEVSGTRNYHYIELNGLYPNTTYKYKIKSGSTVFPPAPLDPLEFTTLSRPSGEYLFSFAVLNDLRYAEGKSNTTSARGIPYQYCAQIITSEVNDINEHNVDFTVVNGNLADSDNAQKYGDQLKNNLKLALDNLNGGGNPPVSTYKYLPVPGYEDKKASYTTDWIEDGFKPLTSDRYSYASSDKDKDSIFNYQFKYKYYNFIFLDSIKKPATASGLASLEALYGYLTAESNSKTFIFMAFPGYNPFATETHDYPVELPTSEVGGGFFNVENHNDFRSTLEAFKDQYGNPIAAAVISGHMGDNYKRDINSISYVRQGPAVQFPTGYSIYKVYTNGYIKTFYKTKGRDGSGKPYYEHARDRISAEAGLPAEVLTQFWLGSNSMRNFTYSYPFIPGVPPRVLTTSPVSAESAVSLNSPIYVTFNKRMDTQNLNSWATVSPSVGTLTASFVDSNRTVLKVNHPNFSVNTTYTVTVLASSVKDEGLSTMEANYVYTFNTNASISDTAPPATVIQPLPGNVTIDPFPSFLGVATDESGVANVEYRVDGNSWISAEAFDGTFNATIEAFKIVLSNPLSTGQHQIEIRSTDGAGNTTASGSLLLYSFSIAEDKPTVSVRVNENRVIPGDMISDTPRISITITSLNSLSSAKLTIDSTSPTLTIVQNGDNYYATYEVTTPLSDGVHGITIEAFDVLGKASTYEISPLYVESAQETAIQGVLLNYPNPFDPSTAPTSISYTLSKAANISVSIFDISGNLIYKRSYSAGESGGRAGYNEIPWDGRSDSGSLVGSGIYIYLIIADGKVVQNGMGKITVFKL